MDNFFFGQAHLKLDRRVDSTAKHRKIHDLLRKLGIWHCANSTIGGTDQDKALSGGEKKRLAFITEVRQTVFCFIRTFSNNLRQSTEY